MPIKKIGAIFLFVQLLFSCQNMEIPQNSTQIIPVPSSHYLTKGNFVLDNSIGIEFPETLKVSAEFLKSFIENGSEIRLQDSNEIKFILDSEIEDIEGYKLNILPKRIEIRASSDQGAFYAVQSLRQMLPAEFENGSYRESEALIPCISISDAPQFVYRGMHLDVGRHLFSVDFIKKYIDALAMLKMNTFHWHLTEDQGWRIEIKKYPRLQEISSFRDQTLVGHYRNQPHQYSGIKYGGYYTQEEIKEVVAYAQERFVTIIPEIELPGHSQAAIAAYPELGCTGKQVEVAQKWGVFEHIYCTKEETFDFLENVLDEVMVLFPSHYIHIGGDEAPKSNWETCNDCQQKIEDEGLKDEHELQNYFITRIEKYLNSNGRQIIGWDEILEGGLAPNATVMSWRGVDGAIEAAKQDHNVIMTPTSHCYFDYYQSENEDEPLAIGGYLPLEKVYSFNPIPEELSEQESKFVLGAQGNIWTEYMPTSEQVEYMAFPRILAMSELVWAKETNKSYKNFIPRVENFHKRLDALSINYANHLYEVEGKLVTGKGNLTYQLSTLTTGKDIRFTKDGTEPTLDSNIYIEPIDLTESIGINSAIFNHEKKLGSTFSETINLHKAVGKKITINKEAHESYPGSGANGLINGISGSDSRYGDKEWLGYWGEDIEVIIDLEKETDITSVYTRCYESNGQWIYLPKAAQIELLNINGESVFNGGIELLTNTLDSKHTSKIGMDFEGIKARYVKLIVQNYGIILDGKQGAGNKAWTFIDEIIVN